MSRPSFPTCLTLALLSCSLCQSAASATNAPSNLLATGVSSSQINLTWSDNSSNETGFTFAWDTNSGLASPDYTYAGGANTTSHSHTGRSAATTYYYKIKAEGNPDSAWTPVESATTAPSGLAAAAMSNSAIQLTWTGNGSNSAITGYTYAYATNSAFTGATYKYVAGNGTASASRTGLSTATTYWFKIKAEGTSDALDSPYGNVVIETTTPGSLTASAVSSSQINLSWTGNSGNPNITGYTVAYATSSSFAGAVYTYVGGATSFNHTGLFAGTTYHYKIKAEGTSDGYDSPFTASLAATTSSAAPNAPSNLFATVVSSSRIDLVWTDNSSDETGFELKRATDSGFTQNVVWIGGIQGTTYSNTGLNAGTTYYYKVRAQGAAQDSAYSASVSAQTHASSEPIPDPPSGLSATAVASTRVDLSWTDNSDNETGFELKRATDSAFTQNVVWIGGIQATSYANTGLSPSTTYYYKVRAEGTAGKSAYSATVNVTTGPSPSMRFAGINAWMPYQIGAHRYYGKLESKWAEVQASGAQIMRYGGNGVDKHAYPMWVEPCAASDPSCVPPQDPCQPGEKTSTMKQYVNMVDAMRARGIEPILQVPVYGSRHTAAQAAELVRCVNVAQQRGVKYWAIGNEPDLDGGGYGPEGYTGAYQVASYFRDFAKAMKEVDPTIKIIGPSITWYDNDDIIHGLTTCGGADDITGRDSNGNYYVDIVSFHVYNGFSGNQTRADVISKLTSAGGLKADLVDLKSRLAQCNSYHGRTGANTLKMAVTEANVNHNQPAGDDIYGVGAASFLGGQFWAEFMGIAMQQGAEFVTFWSTIEGDELGYISGDGTVKRPSYYHFQMVARNFRGSSVAATDNQGLVKTFGSRDVDQIAVLIMNQELSSGFNYTLRLDTGNVSGTNLLKINVDAGIAAEYSGTIARQSSIVLIFSPSGVIKKKIEYKLHGNADATPPTPPTETSY